MRPSKVIQLDFRNLSQRLVKWFNHTKFQAQTSNIDGEHAVHSNLTVRTVSNLLIALETPYSVSLNLR